MSNVEKLKARLAEMNFVHFHADTANKTPDPEAFAAAILASLDAIEAGDFELLPDDDC